MVSLWFCCFQSISPYSLSCWFWWGIWSLVRCNCTPTNYPVKHLALASTRGMGWYQSRPITWHLHKSLNLYMEQRLPTRWSPISGCFEMWCMCSRVWSTKNGKIFPFDSVDKGALEGLCSAYRVNRRIFAVELHTEGCRDDIRVNPAWWSFCDTEIFIKNMIILLPQSSSLQWF